MKKQLLILFFIISNFFIAQSFTGKVISVKDGDTMVVLFENKPITVRLEHIDCPEKTNLLVQKRNNLFQNFVLEKPLHSSVTENSTEMDDGLAKFFTTIKI